MRLLVNGEEMDTAARTVDGLLSELRIQSGSVAVEVNLSIVRKKDYKTYELKEDDQIEVVNFVGGG